MAYSRKNLKKLMSVGDAVAGLLDSKEARMIDLGILEIVEKGAAFIELAIAKAQIEAAEFAKVREKELKNSPMFPGMESDMTISSVDKDTGEIKSVTLTADARKKALIMMEKE